MSNIPVEKVRNFTIAGHAGCGKTSLVEQMLNNAGATKRRGTVEQKNTVSDYRPEEHERGYSLYGTPVCCEWKGHAFRFMDTPGSADFFGDAAAALQVSDTALIVVDGVNGLEVGTGRAWKIAASRGRPRAIFINSLDRDNADYATVLAAVQRTYGATACVPFTLPIGERADLSGVVHVLRGQDVPADLADQVEEYRTALMDTVAESDEELMERYLEGEELTEEEISKGLHSAIADGTLIPVFCGSAANNIGIDELMDGVVNLFPDPLARGALTLTEGELELKADGPGVAFVFKSMMDPFIGQLTLLRVYSGSLSSDSEVINASRGGKERLGSLLQVVGKDQIQVAQAGPGDIVAVAKLKHTRTNDTLCSEKVEIAIPPIDYPKPNMSYACYAESKGEEDKIASGLLKLAEEDPTIRFDRNPETHEQLLSGLGDQHLKVVTSRLKSDYKVGVDLRTPKVPYRETIRGTGTAQYRHKKQSGGHGQFAEVHLRVEPLTDQEFEFGNEVVGGNIPKNFIPSVEKGVVDAMVKGPLAFCKVINVKAVVYDGKYHSVDSSDMAFQIAGRGAFREALQKAQPVLLEPIMKLRVVIPDQYMGDITADLNQRRGRILGMGAEEGMQAVEAEVPQSETFSYSSQLRSLTQGRGSFDLEFVRYEQCPANVSQKVQEEAQRAAEEEG